MQLPLTELWLRAGTKGEHMKSSPNLHFIE